MRSVPRKWRPSLGMVTGALIITVVSLPLVGLVFFRLYENQLIRQTEAELIAQGAALAAAFQLYAENIEPGDLPLGPGRPPIDKLYLESPEPYHPVEPRLDLATGTIYPDRPAAQTSERTISASMMELGERVYRLTQETQKVTLAGFRILDARGTVIGGRDDIGMSLSHVAEIRRALEGYYDSRMRNRVPDRPAPPLYSVSRGTRIRIFTAMPVFVDNQVAGVIYASRTPENILKHLYRERVKVFLACFFMLAVASIVGIAFVRTINSPIRRLIARTKAITKGDQRAIGPLRHHGTRELAQLTQSFMTMARQLSERSDYIKTFTAHVSHELKTPLTAIKGAAEVLKDGGESIAPADRHRFLGNIEADADHMTKLLERLRDLARAETPNVQGRTTLRACSEILYKDFPNLEVTSLGAEDAAFAMSLENTLIALKHLIDNAARHNARQIHLNASAQSGAVEITVSDDGDGISEANRSKIFDAFFTTRRAEGGTGLGLGIAVSILRAHGGRIHLNAGAGLEDRGASFTIRIPTRR